MAGAIAQKAGFDVAFLFLAGMAVLAFLTLLLGVPETKDASREAEAGAEEARPNAARRHRRMMLNDART